MSKSTERIVGLFFFIGLGALIVLMIMIGKGEINIQKKSYPIYALFDSIGGLRAGNIVDLAGMEIGRVNSFRQEGEKIRVELRIDEGIQIRSDSTIKIVEESLLGGRRISITMGTPESPSVAPGSTIPGTIAPGASQLISQLNEGADEAKKTLKEARASIPKLNSAIESASAIIKKVESGEGTLGKIIMDEEIYEEAKKIIPKLSSTVESASAIVRKIEGGEGTLGKIIMDEEVYEEMSGALSSTKDAAEKVGEFTGKMDKLQTYVGLCAGYNRENEQVLSKVYLRFEPCPSKLYLLGGTALTGSGTEWDTSDEADIELDLQVGKRFCGNKLTGRVGLFESRAGAGLDYAFNERLSMTVEGRDVWTKEKDEGIEPFLLRAHLQCRLWRGLYINLGADNILDEPGLNAGIRIEYRDEDIKYLFGAMSATQ